jgi:hypothetical protein
VRIELTPEDVKAAVSERVTRQFPNLEVTGVRFVRGKGTEGTRAEVAVKPREVQQQAITFDMPKG